MMPSSIMAAVKVKDIMNKYADGDLVHLILRFELLSKLEKALRSVFSEEKMRDEFLCYVQGTEVLDILHQLKA